MQSNSSGTWKCVATRQPSCLKSHPLVEMLPQYHQPCQRITLSTPTKSCPCHPYAAVPHLPLNFRRGCNDPLHVTDSQNYTALTFLMADNTHRPFRRMISLLCKQWYFQNHTLHTNSILLSTACPAYRDILSGEGVRYPSPRVHACVLGSFYTPTLVACACHPVLYPRWVYHGGEGGVHYPCTGLAFYFWIVTAMLPHTK